MAGVAQESSAVTMVRPNQNMNSDDLFLMKLSQIVMLGIGFLSIWGGVFSVAFDEDATNQNFLVLFVCGLASFVVSIGLIELQSKKNGYRLQDIQNYFLGIAFFLFSKFSFGVCGRTLMDVPLLSICLGTAWIRLALIYSKSSGFLPAFSI